MDLLWVHERCQRDRCGVLGVRGVSNVTVTGVCLLCVWCACVGLRLRVEFEFVACVPHDTMCMCA